MCITALVHVLRLPSFSSLCPYGWTGPLVCFSVGMSLSSAAQSAELLPFGQSELEV